MTIHPISRENAEHYIWGGVCDGWHLVKEAKLSVIEEHMPPCASEERHYHRSAQQFFFILSGQATLEAEGQHLQLSAGQGAHIPPGIRHQFSNTSSQPVRFLVISQPPSHGDRFAD